MQLVESIMRRDHGKQMIFCDVPPGLIQRKSNPISVSAAPPTSIDTDRGERNPPCSESMPPSATRTPDSASSARLGRRVSFSERSTLHYTYGKKEGNRKAYEKKEMSSKKWKELLKLNQELFPNGVQYGDGTASLQPTPDEEEKSPPANAAMVPLQSLSGLLHWRRHSK